METFGDRLKEQRIKNKLSQTDLAKLLKVRNTTVSAWETNANEPDIKTLKFLAKYFDVTIDYLLAFSDDEGGNVGELVTPMPRPSSSAESGGEPSEPRKRRNASPAPAASDAPEEEEDTSPRVRLRYAARGEGNLYADTTEKKLRKLLEELHKNEINPEDDGI